VIILIIAVYLVIGLFWSDYLDDVPDFSQSGFFGVGFEIFLWPISMLRYALWHIG